MKRARHGLDGFLDDAKRWIDTTAARVPVYGRLLESIARLLNDPAIRDRFEEAWRERAFSAWFDRPLLFLASLRFDAMAEGATHPLHRAIIADPPDADAATDEALRAAVDPSRKRFWQSLRERHVQTNETSRAVAWRWPARLASAGTEARPLALADVGASAGLNLVADALPAIWRHPNGAPLSIAESPHIVARFAFDARPIDPLDAESAQWLRACVWSGETKRLARLDAALAAMRDAHARGEAPIVDAVDAAHVPARLLDRSRALPPGAVLLAYQTHVRDYFPTETRAAYDRGMRDWLAASAPRSALWIEHEPLTELKGGFPAEITAHWNTGAAIRSLVIGRCGHHPEVVSVEDSAVSELTASFQT